MASIKKYLGNSINSVRDNPWLSTAIATPLSLLVANAGYNSLSDTASRLVFAGASPRELRRIQDNLHNNKRLKNYVRLGATYLTAIALNKDIPGGGIVRKLFKPQVSYSSSLSKTASANNLLSASTIPIGSSMNIIQEDPFLKNNQKNTIKSLIYGAENKSYGMTSPRNIAGSAINAGLSAATAIVFGDTMGSIFGVDPTFTRRLSNIGGIAAAIGSTGIFDN